MCDAIYIGKNHNIFKKRMDSNFSDLLRLLKNGQKYDSFADHFEQHFKYTKKCIDLRNYITLKLVNNLNLIVQ